MQMRSELRHRLNAQLWLGSEPSSGFLKLGYRPRVQAETEVIVQNQALTKQPQISEWVMKSRKKKIR